MKRKILLIGILIVIIFQNTSSALSFQVEESFEIPGLNDDIVALDFNTDNEFGSLQIAATDGSNIVVYSTVNDEVIFSTIIDSNYDITHILFDDVNRDLIPDIVVGTKTREFGLVCSTLVQKYDGASDYISIDSTFYTSNTSPISSLFTSLKMLYCLDWNGDTYNELLVSLDSVSVAYYYVYGVIEESIKGKTYHYHSFPDSLREMNSNNYLIFNPIPVREILSPYYMIATRHEGYNSTIAYDIYHVNFYGVIIKYNGERFPLISKNQGIYCQTGSDHYKDVISPQCIFSLDDKNPELFIVSIYDWYQSCYDGNGGIDTSGSEIIMHRLIVGDSTEEIWSVPNYGYNDLVYDSDYPGYFFGISSIDNNIVQFNGFDGSVHARSQSLGTGMKFWDDPYGDSSTKLIVVNNDNVKIYSPGMVTGIVENPDGQILPIGFTLSSPYPNPFNATLSIPLQLNKKSHTTIEAYNLLGQKTDMIYDGLLSQGEQNIQWDANNFSSGIYLIKVTVDDQSQSVKAVLLK